MDATLLENELGHRQLLEGMPAAVYMCDADGRVTLFNQAAAELWGREPIVGEDLWCGSWRIYQPDGTRLPLECCPMAIAIREGRAVQGVEIVVERPDGTRRHVLPHPRPIHDSSGAVVGAINMLVDITDVRRAERDQALLAAIVESSQDAVISVTLDGHITSWNAAAERIFSYSPIEAIGRPINMLIPRERQAEEREILGRIRRGERIEHFETVRLAKDGRRLDVSLTISPIRNRAGQIVGASKISRDVTQQKLVETALRASEERFRTVAMNAPAAIYIKNLDGRYTLANTVACEALGQPEGVVGLTDHELLPPDVADRLRNHDLEVISSGRPHELEEVVQRDGYCRDFLSVKFPLFDAHGKPIGVCGVSTDITQRKRAQEALRESEERFARFMQHLPGLAWIKDAAGRYVFANDAALKAFTLPASELYGKTDAEVFPPETAQHFAENDRRALASESGIQTIETLEHADGKVHYSLVSKFAIPGPDGAPTLVGGMAIDVTDRKEAEEALRASEERFRTLASHAPVGIFQSAPNGDTLFVNECWCAMSGLTQDEARGKGWFQALHPEDRNRVVAGWNEAVQAGRPSEAEFRFLRTDSVVTWLQGNAVPIRDECGELAGYMGTVVDITERKQAEMALKEADRRKDEFLAVLAHELRNPLAPIRTGLELMRLAGDDRALVEDVRATMERQAHQMVRLIDDLLDVSRITRGTVELRKCRVELAAVVQSAVETARPFIDEWGHRLNVSLPKKPVVLEADPTRLAQVISNLLNNAAKYMQRSGEIKVTAECRQGEVILSVKDSGIGIPPDMLERIFDMFTQVDRSTERSHTGLGIGLTLVKRLVEMHGGSVEARSAGSGRGSEFRIRLPVVVGPLTRLVSSNGDDVSPSGRRRVLVADDNEEAARVMGLLLKALGNDVRVAYDGLAAVELAARFQPDIVFLDIGMPKLDGYEAARRIRREPWGREIVLAALTGWGQEDDRQRSREAGFDHHFVKPIEPSALNRLLAE